MAERRADVDEAIRETTRRLLIDSGYRALTIDHIARAAGIGRAAIYRRYASKVELVFDVTLNRQPQCIIPHTDDFAHDLEYLVRNTVGIYFLPDVQASVHELTAELLRLGAAGRAMRESLREPVHRALRERITLGIARGELRSTVNPDSLAGATIGAIHFQVLQTDQPAEEIIRLVTDLVVDGACVPHDRAARADASSFRSASAP